MPQWIDMRYELDCLTYGDGRTVPQGFWAVLRFMRIGEYSQYWHEGTKEAIGGPKWNYDDRVIRVINRPGAVGRGAGGEPLPTLQGSGNDEVNSRVFAILVNNLIRLPLEDDLFYEIGQAYSVQPPVQALTVTSRYKILNVYPVRGDYGREEVIYLSTIRIHGES
jgi:hypothetical protein